MEELVGAFDHGVLLVSDADSQEQIPGWQDDQTQVAVAETALVVRVLHGQVGEVHVRLGEHVDLEDAVELFAGTLRVDSGAVVVSDAAGQQSVRMEVQPGVRRVRILGDRESEAAQVGVSIA